MSKTIKGRVSTLSVRNGIETATIIMDDTPSGLHARDTVEIRRVLTDEEIGRRLRRALTLGGRVDKRGLGDLIESVRDEAGWPIIADLIAEITDLPA